MPLMLLRFNNVAFAYPGWRDFIFRKVSFAVYAGERIGLIGYNGSGKTTILNLIAGNIEPCNGVVDKSSIRLFHLKQEDYAFGNMTVLNYLGASQPELLQLAEKMQEMEQMNTSDSIAYAELVTEFERKGGYKFLWAIEKISTEFGFSAEVLKRKVNTLSGGERRLLKLVSGFIDNYDLYLLDEPTNYLDDNGIQFLVNAINTSNAAFLIISHDRWFLDQAVHKTIEIEQGTTREYNGNYSIFIQTKENEIKTKMKKKEKIETEIRHLKDIARNYRIWGLRKEKEKIGAGDKGFISHRAAKLLKRVKGAKERIQKKIDDLEQAKPHIEKYYAFRFEDVDIPKSSCLCVNGLTKVLGGKNLFADLSFTVDWGEKIVLAGSNGSGKTTLLKILLGLESPDNGEIVWSKLVKAGYLPQQWESYDDNFEVGALFPDDQKEKAHILMGTLKVMQLGNVFSKTLGELSEGQKRKIKLVQLIVSEPNVLIVDEPTTHLDYQTIEFLEKALLDFEGTVILVSHDRFLRERIAGRELTL